jgi:hypothetical protein
MCGGPPVKVSGPWVALWAASDVWEAQGRPTPSNWQAKAAQLAVAAAGLERATMGEADMPFEALVLDGLCEDLPAEEGWDAYRLLVNRDAPTGGARLTACLLAARRLRVFSGLLPVSLRPPIPFPLDHAGDATTDADLAALGADSLLVPLRDWRKALMEAFGDRGVELSDNRVNLDLYLFGLPGAVLH